MRHRLLSYSAAVAMLSVSLATTFIGTAAQGLIPSETQASIEAFNSMAKVLTHPRCQNCHTQTHFPLQGDDRHPHGMNVQRGDDGQGVAAQRCGACHGRANNAASGVPGADEDWHLAPLSMGWEGRSLAELCRGLKDPKLNGGRTGAQLVEHFATPLVRWGWRPGARADGTPRSVPPTPYAEFVAAAQRWLATGAACPE